MTASQSLKIYELLHAQMGKTKKARLLTEAVTAVIVEGEAPHKSELRARAKKDLEWLRLRWFAGTVIVLAQGFVLFFALK